MNPAEQRKQFTLVFVLDIAKRRVLLGMKKRGFGKDKYNGFGGKLEPGETIEQAAFRELQEESLVKAKNLKKIGINLFKFEGDPVALEVHIYYTTDFEGTPTETEEMRPQWFSYDDMPYDEMWADDRYWFPKVIEKKCFKSEFHFTKDQNQIIFSSVREEPVS